MDENTLAAIFLVTLLVLGFTGWMGCLYYFNKKSKMLLEAIKNGCDPIFAEHIFKDTTDNLAIIRLLSNNALDLTRNSPVEESTIDARKSA